MPVYRDDQEKTAFRKIMRSIGVRLAKWRTEAGFHTVGSLAKAANVAPPAIHRIEDADSTSVEASIHTFAKVSKQINRSMDELYWGSRNSRRPGS